MDNNTSLGKDVVIISSNDSSVPAHIHSGKYEVSEHGINVTVSVSSVYSKIKINGIELFFIRETGEYDGWAIKTGPDGPILVTSS